MRSAIRSPDKNSRPGVSLGAAPATSTERPKQMSEKTIPNTPLINRRTLLSTAAAAAVALPTFAVAPAQAEAMANPALRAIHRFHIGAMTVTMIDDAAFTFPGPAFATNQPEGSIGPFLSRFGLPQDFVTLHMQVTLVQSGANTVLLDTGMGDVTFPGNTPDNGRLIASLAAVGVKPADITHVILSHGHPDHIGACTTNGAPTFRNAAYYLPPQEMEFWTQKPGAEANFPNFMLGVGNAQLEPLRGLIRPYKDGEEIVPGITAILAPGHTLAHHAFLLEDGGQKLLHMVDAAVHYLVAVEEPDWSLAVEMDPETAVKTRRNLFAQAAQEKMLVAGYHFPFPGIGVIVEQGKAWRFVPIPTA